MFTGIIEAVGYVRAFGAAGRSVSLLELEVPGSFKDLKAGSSLAVNGACLTVVQKKGRKVFFHVIRETVERTALGDLRKGDPVNLERPLRFGGRVEGHFVLGHVDGAGKVLKVENRKEEKSFFISFPKRLKPYFFEKGSVAVDGASLTLGKVLKNGFWIHSTPYTLEQTNFHAYQAGVHVNLEADALVKCVERLFRLTYPERHYKL
ncbi:MAG: riboflavin synthase [Candidatus Omnitrophica bacterium]|nr:riboflavin synthase [Candidatus Omnitrophota bacterium]